MAARPCPVSLCECPGVDAPITNISAEAPDPLLFWGQIWNPYNPYKPPPLGNGIDVKVDCDVFNEIFSIYDPIVYAGTQLMANLQALAASLGCPWPTSGTETFTNDEQSATVYCADGSSFTYTVDAGTMTSPPMDAELGAAWVEWANAWAAAYAYAQASAQLECIVPSSDGDGGGGEPLPPTPPGDDPPTPPSGAGILSTPLWCCADDEVLQSYIVTGARTIAYNITMVAGSIPTGTTLTQTGPRRVTLSGFPSVPGAYNFTIRGVSTTFPTMVVEATIYFYVMGISNSHTLAAGGIGVAYSETLLGAGGTAPYTFALDSGSTLPPGLSLATGGTISGMPSAEGDFSFDVVITDANDGECIQSVDLSAVATCIVDTDCNLNFSTYSCTFPATLTISDWNTRKLELIAPTADPAGAQPEWDGTLPIYDETTLPGSINWVPAGSVPPVWQPYAINGLLGNIIVLRSQGVVPHTLYLVCEVGGVPTTLWQGQKVNGEHPIGTFMRTAGLSAGPACFHVTGPTSPSAMAWWTMEANPIAVVDSSCGLVLSTIGIGSHSIIAGHVLNALRIHSDFISDHFSECLDESLSFTTEGLTIVLWVRAIYNISFPGNNSEAIQYRFFVGGIEHILLVEHFEGGNWIATLDGAGAINKAFAAGWHFLVITYDPLSGDLGFDVDQSGMTTAAVGSLFADASPLSRIIIGNVTGHLLLNGDIDTDFDELAVYNGILTNAQLNCIYNAGAGRTW